MTEIDDVNLKGEIKKTHLASFSGKEAALSHLHKKDF
jgi:hypothetical protein